MLFSSLSTSTIATSVPSMAVRSSAGERSSSCRRDTPSIAGCAPAYGRRQGWISARGLTAQRRVSGQ